MLPSGCPRFGMCCTQNASGYPELALLLPKHLARSGVTAENHWNSQHSSTEFYDTFITQGDLLFFFIFCVLCHFYCYWLKSLKFVSCLYLLKKCCGTGRAGNRIYFNFRERVRY